VVGADSELARAFFTFCLQTCRSGHVFGPLDKVRQATISAVPCARRLTPERAELQPSKT
jgi:hypothetical protein